MVGVILPGSVSAASMWALADYRTVRGSSAPAAADGIAQLTLPQLAGEEMWLVDHAVIACDSTTATVVRWYESSVDDLRLLDGTASGNFDVGDWPAGLQLGPSQELIIRWSGASVGAVGTATLQVRLLRRA